MFIKDITIPIVVKQIDFFWQGVGVVCTDVILTAIQEMLINLPWRMSIAIPKSTPRTAQLSTRQYYGFLIGLCASLHSSI